MSSAPADHWREFEEGSLVQQARLREEDASSWRKNPPGPRLPIVDGRPMHNPYDGAYIADIGLVHYLQALKDLLTNEDPHLTHSRSDVLIKLDPEMVKDIVVRELGQMIEYVESRVEDHDKYRKALKALNAD